MKKILVAFLSVLVAVSTLLAFSSCANSDEISIGENGNWYINGTDTGVSAVGPKGDDGDKGADGKAGVDGIDGIDGKDGIDGEDAEDGKGYPEASIRYNTGSKKYEYSFDGENWIEMEYYTPDDQA